jgi:hypothetical protein
MWIGLHNHVHRQEIATTRPLQVAHIGTNALPLRAATARMWLAILLPPAMWRVFNDKPFPELADALPQRLFSNLGCDRHLVRRSSESGAR